MNPKFKQYTWVHEERTDFFEMIRNPAKPLFQAFREVSTLVALYQISILHICIHSGVFPIRILLDKVAVTADLRREGM